MKIKKQLTVLETSLRLQKLEVEQESYWSWVKHPATKDYKIMSCDMSGRTNLLAAGYNVVSAFTVAELGEIINKLLKKEQTHKWKSYKGLKWFAEFSFGTLVEADTEAETRAKMLIYLLENKLIEL